MEAILSSIAAAVVAGASARAKDVASRVVLDTYEALKAALIRKIGKAETLQRVEEAPESAPAQTSLVEMLANHQSAIDMEIRSLAEAVATALAQNQSGSKRMGGNIEVDVVRGGIDAIVEDLSARGTIRLGSVVAVTGTARLSGLTAGTDVVTAVGSTAAPSRLGKGREKN